MRLRRLLAFVSLLACAAAIGLVACSSSPKANAQKKKRTILLTEYDDARVGAEASREIESEMGLLDDPELEAYVNQVGKRVLRGVPRRSFHFHFSIVDQFEPNAFALPGGYIFISRGMLALANSEDELANVIGHEIVHAARRHAAARQEVERGGNPLSMPWVRAANLAAYGRDMERTADREGQMLAAAVGYDPMGMSTFLSSLGQMERLLIGRTRLPTFFDTHPGSRGRAAANAARANEIRWKRDPSLGDTKTSYLRRIEGLPLGDRPEAGVFQGDLFLHPDLDFQINFPPGWRTSNSNRAVGAVSPRGDAVVFLTADLPPGDPREVAKEFAAKTQREFGVQLKKSQPVKIGRLDAWRIQLEGNRKVANVTFVPYRGSTWRITGFSSSDVAKRYLPHTLNTARSFRPLTEEQRKSIEVTRIDLVEARSGEDLVALGRRTGNSWDPSRTAVLNGVFSNHRFEGGELVKIARVEPYSAKPPK
jgi:predicted Zn-dependent protease